MKKHCAACGKEAEMLSWEDECFPCRDKKHYAKIKDQIVSGEIDYTDYENEIVCPYCGEVIENYDDYHLYEEGEHKLECPECEKEFMVETYISYSYSTSRQDEEDEDT